MSTKDGNMASVYGGIISSGAHFVSSSSSSSSLSGASSPDMEPSYAGGLFDMVKGGAGRLFSNLKDNLKDTLKDTSSRVIQSVSR